MYGNRDGHSTLRASTSVLLSSGGGRACANPSGTTRRPTRTDRRGPTAIVPRWARTSGRARRPRPASSAGVPRPMRRARSRACAGPDPRNRSGRRTPLPRRPARHRPDRRCPDRHCRSRLSCPRRYRPPRRSPSPDRRRSAGSAATTRIATLDATPTAHRDEKTRRQARCANAGTEPDPAADPDAANSPAPGPGPTLPAEPEPPQLSTHPLRTPAPAVTSIRVLPTPIDGFDYQTASLWFSDALPPAPATPGDDGGDRARHVPLETVAGRQPGVVENPVISWLDEDD